MNKYNIVDLFSGAGGLSLGFKQTGQVNIVAAAENNPNARKTYKRNFKEVERLYADVRTIDYGELLNSVGTVDIVIGGPPCQGFSNANRQHSTIISMNNRLVKEYVRAICELQPKAFVMENVAMLRSAVHRFLLEETDLTDNRIMNLDLNEDNIEILAADSNFDGIRELLLDTDTESQLAWTESFYKTINLLYRYRINQSKFELTLEKYEKKLKAQLSEVIHLFDDVQELNVLQQNDVAMAHQLVAYYECHDHFEEVIASINKALSIQKALLKIKELQENHIHVFGYVEMNGALCATVKSYSVVDYVKGILENEPYNYTLTGQTLNALDYGAPQRRERYIIVGTKSDLGRNYESPVAIYSEGEYRTVRDAISDIQEIEPTTK